MNKVLLILFLTTCSEAFASIPVSILAPSQEERESNTLADIFQKDTQHMEQSWANIDALAQKPPKSITRYSYLHAAMGAASVGGILAWLKYAKPEEVARSVHTRFVTGAEIPVAVGIAKVFLGPLVALVVGYYIYYKIKSAIADPYERKNKEIADEFKKLLLEHKVEINEVYKKREEKVQRDTSQMRENLIAIQQQMEKMLQEDREQDAAKYGKILEEFNALKSKLLSSHEKVESDLENLEKNIQKLSQINGQLGNKAVEAIEGLKNLLGKIDILNKHQTRDQEIIVSHGQALKALQKQIKEDMERVKQQLAGKKDKK